MATTKMLESIVEYSQKNDSPAFRYDEKTGAITIFAGESKWIRKGTGKVILLNNVMHYDDDKYVLLFLPYTRKRNISPEELIIPSGAYSIILYNTGLLPKLIRQGELLGKAILVPKIESHILELKLYRV